MFHDLDVSVPPPAREEALRTLQMLGYDVIAFSTVVSGQKKLSPQNLPHRRDWDSFKHCKSTLLHPEASKRKRGITVLERLTIVIDDMSQLSIFNSPELNQFDLVAVRPDNEKLFQQCLQFDFDIISLPLDRRHSFQLKRPHIHVASEKGLMFEIAYARGLRDTTLRRNMISNACSISAATSGKHLLLSSGALTTMELRAPLDVINLAVLFDVPQQLARDAVVSNAEAVVTHGDVRARVHKGIVKVNRVPTPLHDDHRLPNPTTHTSDPVAAQNDVSNS